MEFVGAPVGKKFRKISFEINDDRQIGIWLLQSSICCYGTQYQVMGGKANMEDCVFCKIGSGEIQGLRICEDDEALAFMDISNDYDGHILVIPKKHYRYVTDCPENVACKVWFMVQKVSKHLIEDCGYDGADIMSANSPVSQSLPHFHVHIIPRKIGDRLGNPGEWPTPARAKEDVRVMHERLKMI